MSCLCHSEASASAMANVLCDLLSRVHRLQMWSRLLDQQAAVGHHNSLGRCSTHEHDSTLAKSSSRVGPLGHEARAETFRSIRLKNTMRTPAGSLGVMEILRLVGPLNRPSYFSTSRVRASDGEVSCWTCRWWLVESGLTGGARIRSSLPQPSRFKEALNDVPINSSFYSQCCLCGSNGSSGRRLNVWAWNQQCVA